MPANLSPSSGAQATAFLNRRCPASTALACLLLHSLAGEVCVPSKCHTSMLTRASDCTLGFEYGLPKLFQHAMSEGMPASAGMQKAHHRGLRRETQPSWPAVPPQTHESHGPFKLHNLRVKRPGFSWPLNQLRLVGYDGQGGCVRGCSAAPIRGL